MSGTWPGLATPELSPGHGTPVPLSRWLGDDPDGAGGSMQQGARQQAELETEADRSTRSLPAGPSITVRRTRTAGWSAAASAISVSIRSRACSSSRWAGSGDGVACSAEQRQVCTTSSSQPRVSASRKANLTASALVSASLTQSVIHTRRGVAGRSRSRRRRATHPDRGSPRGGPSSPPVRDLAWQVWRWARERRPEAGWTGGASPHGDGSGTPWNHAGVTGRSKHADLRQVRKQGLAARGA